MRGVPVTGFCECAAREKTRRALAAAASKFVVQQCLVLDVDHAREDEVQCELH
jgi:hypothetical protein